ncbi:MAG: hypothetical protein C4541_12450 [Candidatus Auribacter fodinae]|uniref:SLBB domain-containing protein n=1 Tax=Candidatus Auribacter fodinae TaxID=2093366 RepID=A0A3A4QUD4_9BACT|nr:MAG: hypothetical protein C4541_12450 [Candidatus Auribacter fodinae]
MKKLNHSETGLIFKTICTAIITTTLIFPPDLMATMSVPLLTGRAVYLYNENKLDESLIQWNKILELDPANKLAQSYTQKIKESKSRRKTKAEDSIDPANLKPVVYDPVANVIERNASLGLEYFHRKNYEEAEGRWNAILNRYPDNITIRKYMALTLFKENKFDRSLQEWIRVQKQDSEDAQAKQYIDILSEKTYVELEEIAQGITLPKPKIKSADVTEKPFLSFEGVDSTLLFSGYSVDRSRIDEDTAAFDEEVRIRTSINGDPLHIEQANTVYRNHPDALDGVGTLDSGDYEAFDRFRRLTTKYYGKNLQVLVGDIHTHYLFSKNPSKFIYPGIDYRGVNVIYTMDKFRGKFLWGLMPLYELRRTVTGAPREGSLNRLVASRDSLEFSRNYFYPREVTAVDAMYEFHPQYTLGAIYAHTEDHSHIKKISNRFPSINNYMLSVNQSINLFPGKRVDLQSYEPEFQEGKTLDNFLEYLAYMKENFKWYIFHEVVYSWYSAKVDNSLEIYSPLDELNRDENLEDWATFLRSEMAMPKVHSEIIYQRVGTDFRNPSGFTYAQTVTYDREYMMAKTYYYPKDDLNFSLNTSKIRSDLPRDPYVAKKDWNEAKLNMRWLPGGMMPDVSMDGSFANYKSSERGEYAPNDWLIGAYCIGLSKTIMDWDLHGQYKITSSRDDQHAFDETYINFFSLEAFKTLWEGVDFSVGHFNTDKNIHQPSPSWDFDRDTIHTDVTLSFDLWDTSSLSFFYSYLTDTDNFEDPDQAKVHSLSTTYAWPIYITLRDEKKLDLYPYITCLTNESGRKKFDNIIVEPSFRAKYQINQKSFINLQSSYRHDTGYEDEFRCYMYLTFGFDAEYVNVKSADSMPTLNHLVKRQQQLALNTGESITINVIDKKKLHAIASETVVIDSSGMINSSLCAPVSVLNASSEEVETRIEKLLTGQLAHCEVKISPANQSAGSVVVLGEVLNPGIYSINQQINLYDAISLAGGTDPYRANHTAIKVTRNSTGETFVVNLHNYLNDTDTTKNIAILDGDIISVPKTAPAHMDDFFAGIFGRSRDKKLRTKKAVDNIDTQETTMQEKDSSISNS